MRIDVCTLFPDLVEAHAATSLIGRARRLGLVEVVAHDIRASASDRHRSVDDTPFGGGPGMVMRADVVGAAVQTALDAGGSSRPRMLVMTPAGRRLDQASLHDLADEDRIVVLCGRYEGVDERVVDEFGFEPVSIGDYVVAGGEVAAMVVVEGVVRLVPGVMGNEESAVVESHEDGLLEAPVYTRPPDWRGHEVPAVLRSGDHAAVARWRRTEALRRTAAHRPDLLRAALADGRVTPDDLAAAGVDPATITR